MWAVCVAGGGALPTHSPGPPDFQACHAMHGFSPHPSLAVKRKRSLAILHTMDESWQHVQELAAERLALRPMGLPFDWHLVAPPAKPTPHSLAAVHVPDVSAHGGLPPQPSSSAEGPLLAAQVQQGGGAAALQALAAQDVSVSPGLGAHDASVSPGLGAQAASTGQVLGVQDTGFLHLDGQIALQHPAPQQQPLLHPHPSWPHNPMAHDGQHGQAAPAVQGQRQSGSGTS